MHEFTRERVPIENSNTIINAHPDKERRPNKENKNAPIKNDCGDTPNNGISLPSTNVVIKDETKRISTTSIR